MISQHVTVSNKYGIHCRPSAIIAKEAQGYSGKIYIRKNQHQQADATSILLLIGLGIRCGETVTVEVTGPTEKATCERMVTLFETDFDFPRDE